MNPFQTAPNSKKILTLIGVYIALITSLFVSVSDSILLPVAAKEIGGLDYYPLSTSLSGCLSISLMPLYGFIAAKSPSAKRLLMVFSFLIAGAIVLCRGLAASMWAIIIPSFFAACYAPAIYVLGYSTIRDMYDARQASVFLGLAGTMMAIGTICGAPLFGALTGLAGWRFPFFVIGPLFMIAAVLVFFGVKVTKEEAGDMVSTKASFDFPGAAALIVFLSSLILALSLGKLAPFGGTVSNVLWIVCAAALIVLIIVMKKKKARAIVPTTVLSDRNTLSLLIFSFFINMSMMCLYVFMPLYAMYELKQSPAAAGLIVTFYGIATLFMSPVYGRLIAKAANARSVAVLSAAIRIAALIVLIVLLKPAASMYLVFALMFILGFSQSGGTVVSAVAAMIQIPEEKRQLGNAVVQLGPGMGATIGIAVYSAVIGAAGIAGGFITSLVISTAASVIVLCAGLLLRKLPVPAAAGQEGALSGRVL